MSYLKLASIKLRYWRPNIQKLDLRFLRIFRLLKNQRYDAWAVFNRQILSKLTLVHLVESCNKPGMNQCQPAGYNQYRYIQIHVKTFVFH